MSLSNVRKYLFSSSSLFVVIGLIFILISGIINSKTEKPILELSKQDTALNINSDILVFMSAGNKRILTDLLWIQTLLESDIEHYKKQDLNSWLFLRFNSIALLDPLFYENYLFGGQYLAIVKDDLEGADVIYDKGLKNFPDDYRLNFNSGFMNYFEIGNREKGLKLLSKIQDHSRSPFFIKSIIHKLQLATGTDLKEIYQLVIHSYENAKDEKLKNKLKSDLYAIKSEIDLKCLNNQHDSCEKLDLDGKPYILQDGIYYSKKKFLLYRINSREETSTPRSPINTLK